MQPTTIGERLLAHGFTCADEPGMAIDLEALADSDASPHAFLVERVRDDWSLDEWAHTLALGFGEGEREAFWVRDMYRRIGLDDDRWRHYLGRLENDSVATASLFLSAGVAGVYFVSTAPPARRQGIGAAITRAALLDARALGRRVAVLGSSEMGHGVYRRLGFQDVCACGVYEWFLPDA